MKKEEKKMDAEEVVYSVNMEESKTGMNNQPSAGPVYRSIYAKDGLLDLPTGLDSLWDFFSGSVKRHPQNKMLGHREDTDEKASAYNWKTYEEVYDEAIKVACAIRGCVVNPGGRCGIYGSNCPEWVIAMEACNSQGICYVPLYDTLGPNAVEFIINHSEISIAFVQETKIKSMLTCLARCSNYLKTIVSFGLVADEQKQEAESIGVSCFSWEAFVSTAVTICKLPPKHMDDVCTIMYTSGTTGEPKGVILTNRALMSVVISMEHLFLDTDKVVNEDDCYLSYLPLAHVFDQIIENYCIYKGASIGFWRGDVRYLMEDIQELKPTIFIAVPRVYDRIYTGIKQKISSGGGLMKMLFQYAYVQYVYTECISLPLALLITFCYILHIELILWYLVSLISSKLKNLKKGIKQEEASPLFDRLVFNKIKQVLGGRVRIMISGAAPLPKHVDEFLRVTCCSILIQGYGLTESCAGSFSTIPNVFPMIGTVGVPLKMVEARLESVPDMGYDALSSSTPRGEICLRGQTLFSGYHKRPDLTDEVFVDGWLHTGDIGEWQPNGSLKIIDRKKNIFKLSQGEYIAVENIESAYSHCPLITSIWVYGNSFESFLVGVAVPERKPLQDWAAANNVSSATFEELCKLPKVHKYILGELTSTGKTQQLRGFEMLKAIYLEPVPFDMERDLITATFKLKRPQLLNYYKERIDDMYQEVKGTQA